jgi:hypothetical protein
VSFYFTQKNGGIKMPNKYANLVGTNHVKDEFGKINDGFAAVEVDVVATNTRVEQIITTPITGEAAAQEVVDARQSTVKGKAFTTLDARMDEAEQDTKSQMADIANMVGAEYPASPKASQIFYKIV